MLNIYPGVQPGKHGCNRTRTGALHALRQLPPVNRGFTPVPSAAGANVRARHAPAAGPPPGVLRFTGRTEALAPDPRVGRAVGASGRAVRVFPRSAGGPLS